MTLISHTVVYGPPFPLQAALPVRVSSGNQTVVLQQTPSTVVIQRKDEKVELSAADGVLYSVEHQDFGPLDIDLDDASTTDAVLEEALEAISQAIIWTKSKDLLATTSCFARPVGRVDVKYFVVEMEDEEVIVAENPLQHVSRKGLQVTRHVMGNLFMTNGPAAEPMPPIVRRAMSTLDLINLGFCTEAFVSLFAVTDDLVQSVVKAGLAARGMPPKDQKELLRSIKERRLELYVTSLLKLVGWQGLHEANPELLKDLVSVNALRNSVMHRASDVTRDEAIRSCNILFQVLGWLDTNPFGVRTGTFPKSNVARFQFGVSNSLRARRKEQGGEATKT